jgi:hypothetical protein
MAQRTSAQTDAVECRHFLRPTRPRRLPIGSITHNPLFFMSPADVGTFIAL